MGVKILVISEGDKEFKSLLKKALSKFDGRLKLSFDDRCQLKDDCISGANNKADIVIINGDNFIFRPECPVCFAAISSPKKDNCAHVLMATRKFSVESFLFNQQRGVSETVDISKGPENLVQAISSVIGKPL
ncbi:MAG: hypothetical protein HZB29_10105 [Nitrospinae bacterium]|nr:hypothetical protein [Nitrospinota bacterium]